MEQREVSVKSLIGHLVIACDEIVDMPETASINLNNKTNCWIFAAVLLTIEPLLWLMVIVATYYLKSGLLIPCLILQQYIMLEYDRIDISEDIDINKTSDSHKLKVCHYWHFFEINFTDQPLRRNVLLIMI